MPNLYTPKFLEMSASCFLNTCTFGYVQVSFLVLNATQLMKDQGHFTDVLPFWNPIIVLHQGIIAPVRIRQTW